MITCARLGAYGNVVTAMASNQSETVAVTEAARRLGVHHQTLYRAVERGEVPCIRIGRRIRIPLRFLDSVLAGGSPALEGEADEQ